jgi:PPOX class probable F420-dependent enzyme
VDDLNRARYISLTTFKMDGSPVSSAVWVTGEAGDYVFTTGDQAWKTKRLRRNPSVQVQVCTVRGRVTPQAIRYVGTGTVESSAEAVAEAEQALAAKYGWQFRATKVADRLARRFGRGEPQHPVAIRLSLRNG